ncbi:MAG: IS630 family transposase [Flavobacteriales bacterium]|nr:IS630 family transposase [Flavobacteriales bacterium]
MPDQLKLPYALWSRKAVRLLIKDRYGVELAARTMTEYMRRWGFTSQKPTRRAMEPRPAEVRRWKERVHPAIAKRAKAEGAEILWGDETGVRSDDVRGRSFAKRVHTPIVRVGNKCFGRSIISAVSARGGMRSMVFKGVLDVRCFKRFLSRSIKDAKRKVFLIVDDLRVHHAKVLAPWLLKHKERIEIFYLPSYFPEINPVEVAKADLKREMGDKPPAQNEEQMVRAILAHYHNVQRQPLRILKYFQHPDVRYAA